jgi:ethanolamine ammonia-lyase small subunit
MSSLTPDPWNKLRLATSARIALGRAGGSLPTREWLEFKSAHAAAREAVHYPFDAEKLAADIAALGAEVVVANSAAGDRLTFLQRPDLGRRLDDRSRFALQELGRKCSHRALRDEYTFDLVIIVSDGLSALAVHRQAPLLLVAMLPMLLGDGSGAWGRASGESPAASTLGARRSLDPSHPQWNLAPIVVTRFGRVALQDEIGSTVGAQLALTLIGERPGLGSPDSLGAYLVYDPKPGNTDASRNCVSNIRPEGLPCEAAAETLHYLLTEARRRKNSGVQLKDERVRSLAGDLLGRG